MTSASALLRHAPKGASPLERLRKRAAGEGARGGRVIGHTRSGKPIYESGDHRYADVKTAEGFGVPHSGAAVRRTYPDFTRQDHRDAYELHQRNGSREDSITNDHAASGRYKRETASRFLALGHYLAARGHRQAQHDMLAAGQ